MKTEDKIPLFDIIDVSAAERLLGVPQYGYFKAMMQSARRARRVEFFKNSWLPCSKEEFDQEKPQSDKHDMNRFMGKPSSFYYAVYEKRVTVDGWPQKLIKLIEQHAKETLPAPNQ